MIARRNVYLKRAGVAYFNGLTSGDSIVIRAKTDNIQKILPFVFNTAQFWDYASKHADGSMSKRLSPKNLLEFEVNLPSNDAELTKLSDLLWSMYDSMHSYEDVIAKSDELIKSQFIEMFNSFETIDLVEIADITMGQSPDSKSYNDDGIGMPFLQGKADFGDKYCKVFHWTTEPSKIVDAGSILMSVRAPVGPVNFTKVKCCIGRGLCGINAKQNITNNEFLYNALKVKEDEIASKGVGSTFAAITKKDVHEIKMPKAPITKMDEFSVFAEQIDKSKFEIEKSLSNLKKIYEKVLRDNF